MTQALPPREQVRSIACLMLGGIGDILVTTPTIRALRRAYPEARLSVILRREFAELAAGNPGIDEIVTFRSGGPLRKAAFLAKLAARHWDLWVDLHVPTFNTVSSNEVVFRRNALMMRAARSRWRLGFAVPPLAARLTHRVAVPPMDVLASENIACTTLRLTGQPPPPDIQKELPPVFLQARASADAVLASLGADSRPCIGIFFGSKQPSDVWPYDNLRRCCLLLHLRYPGHQFLILGGAHEHALAERLRADLGDRFFPPFLNLVGRLSLAQTAASLQRCVALIATDSGPMHMGDALDIPLVALFGSKNHLRVWLPLSASSVVLNHAVQCGPCFSDTCPRQNLCMDLIQPEEVIEALATLLARDCKTRLQNRHS